jgi:hypothetical protein
MLRSLFMRGRYASWLFVVTISAVVAGLFAGSDAGLPSPGLLVWLIGATLAAPLIYRLVTGAFDPFEPVIWFLLAWLIMFVIHPAAMIVDQDIFYHDPWRTIDLSPTFAPALRLGLVGAVAFLVAYFTPAGSLIAGRWRRPPADVAWDVLTPAAILTGIVGIILEVLWLHSTGSSPLGLFSGRAARTSRELIQINNGSSYLLHGPYLLIPAAIILITAGLIRRDRIISAIGWGFAALAILRALALGDRAMLLPMVAGLLIFAYLRRGRRPKFIAFAGVIIAALYLATIIGDTRTADYRSQSSVLTAIQRATTQPSHDLATLTHSNDSSEIRTLAAAMLYVPSQIGYQYGGASIGDVVTRPVPRKFWAGKPLPPAQQVFSVAIPESFAAGTSNKASSSLLVFYMDGGIFGVIIGMALYGAFARAMYEYYRTWQSSVYAQLMLALFTALMASAMRDGFADTVERMALVVGPVWVIYRLSGSRRLSRALHPRGPRSRPLGVEPQWNPPGRASSPARTRDT